MEEWLGERGRQSKRGGERERERRVKEEREGRLRERSRRRRRRKKQAERVIERERGVCEGVCFLLSSVNEWKASPLSPER